MLRVFSKYYTVLYWEIDPKEASSHEKAAAGNQIPDSTLNVLMLYKTDPLEFC